MAATEKSLDAQIAEHEELIEKLKAAKTELEAKKNFQPYPKHITVPAAPAEASDAPKTQTVVVNSAAEEEAVLKPTKAVEAEKK